MTVVFDSKSCVDGAWPYHYEARVDSTPKNDPGIIKNDPRVIPLVKNRDILLRQERFETLKPVEIVTLTKEG